MKKHLLILALCLGMLACKEEDGSATPEPTTLSEMISRTWKVQSVMINGQADNATDYSNYRFTFNTNQTYSFAIPDNHQGTWELIANATALTLDKGTAQEQRIEVPTLNETLLQLEFTEQSEKTGTRRILYALAP